MMRWGLKFVELNQWQVSSWLFFFFSCLVPLERNWMLSPYCALQGKRAENMGLGSKSNPGGDYLVRIAET